MNFGPSEIIIIILIALIIFGWRRLPDLPRSLQQSLQYKPGEIEIQLPNRRRLILLSFVAGLVFVTVLLADLEIISERQMLIALFVFITWLVVGWFCFNESNNSSE